MKTKYSFHLAWSDEDEAYIASCPEFPGLLAHGDTPEEAIRAAESALELNIETYSENNMPLPEPLTRQEYSGQFRVRLPKSLHRQAALMAEREEVSLNTFVATAIAEKVGVETSKKAAAPVINIEIINWSPNMPFKPPSQGPVATTGSVFDQWNDHSSLKSPCRDQ